MRNQSGSTKEQKRRERNRWRMARVREQLRKERKCRQCGRPVAKSERTGKLSRQCRKHLLEERARKTPPELPWEETPFELVEPWADEKVYILRWLDE